MRFFAGFMAVALLAAGCAPTSLEPGRSGELQGDEARTQDGVDIRPHPEEARRPDQDEEPEIPDLARADLMGLDAAGVAELLGTPMQRRREGPANVWQYRSEDCVVDLFLYASDDGTPASAENGAAATVDYIEARDRAAQPAEFEPCLRSVLRERLRSQPMG